MKNLMLVFGLLFISNGAQALSGHAEIYSQWAYENVKRCELRTCAMNDGWQSYDRECEKLRINRTIIGVQIGPSVFEVRNMGDRCFCDCGMSLERRATGR